MQCIILLGILPHALAVRDEKFERTPESMIINTVTDLPDDDEDTADTALAVVEQMSVAFQEKAPEVTKKGGTELYVPVDIFKYINMSHSNGRDETVHSFVMPVKLAKDIQEAPSQGNAPQGNASQGKKDVIEDGRAEFQTHMDKLPFPQNPSCAGKQNNRSFNFAIGSIFNDESKRGYALKTEIFTRGLPESNKSLEHRDSQVKYALRRSRLTCPQFATIDSGFRRMWTYPSSDPWMFWAVSLHKDQSSETPVLGGLTEVDKDWFGMMRPRESEYDVLTLSPDLVTLSKTGKTLRQTYPCDRIFVFGYGYNRAMDELQNGIADVASMEPRLNKFYQEARATPSDQTPNLRLCELPSQDVGSETQCKEMLRSAFGHVLVQSYIDVIIAGILETGVVSKVGKFEVLGGATTKELKTPKYEVQQDYAVRFAETTTWPVKEVAEKRVLYINDRRCPRNPNPMYAKRELLHPQHQAGIASTAPDTEEMWGLIDEIMANRSEDARKLLDHRINGAEVCEKLDQLPRWLDKVLEGEKSLWDLVYRNNKPKTAKQNCQDL